ncbi:MAG TPA: helix-turn-helix domain-containing protein [Solirubrobacterales bacterium]
MSPVTLSSTIRAAREARSLSLRDLRAATAGERYPDGLAVSYLQRLERGRVEEPSPHALRAIARPLGVAYATLMRQAGYYP